MKIVTWNCCWDLGSERERDSKKAALLNLDFDIAVVPEASRPDIESFASDGFSTQWIGEDERHGLGMLAKKPMDLTNVQKCGTLMATVDVERNRERVFTLVAVWPVAKGYAGYTKEILNSFKNAVVWPDDQKVIVAGDFNSNAQWNSKCPKDYKHSSIVEFLEKKNLLSAYHAKHNNGRHGDETAHTYHHLWNAEDGFHLDYIFVPKDWMERASVHLGIHQDWLKHSDHCPLSVEIN